QPGGLVAQERGRLELSVRLRQRELDALIRSDRPAEHDTTGRVRRGAFDEPASVAQRLRRDEDPLGVPAVDDVAEAMALSADEIGCRHFELVDEELGR